MGHSDIDRRRVYTSKTIKEDVFGDHVWLVVGKGKGKKKKTFFLGSHFVIDDVTKNETGEFDYEVSGSDGRIFSPMISLDNFEWFEQFRKDNHYFSFGFREIKDMKIVHEFEKLSKSVE